MAQYFLHQRRGGSYIHDLEGADFDTGDKAREEAIMAARELISEMVLTGVADLSASFEIMDGDGVSFSVLFSEAVTLLPERAPVLSKSPEHLQSLIGGAHVAQSPITAILEEKSR
jgi:hypothetical protein